MSQRVAVIGAGPAGLAAASALSARGAPVTVLDAGMDLARRRHDSAEHLGSGVGGTGLFSDGKFSYFPSGTGLYQLQNKARLAEAYDWCIQQLQCAGIPVEPFPALNGGPHYTQQSADGVKPYPSHYATLEQRHQLVESLCKSIAGDVITSCLVHRLASDSNRYGLSYRRTGSPASQRMDVEAAVLASGRLGALDISERRLRCSLSMQQQRYDLGLRIEAPAKSGFLSRMRAADVKRIWISRNTQVRTFCTCREGEVWNIPFWGLSAVSGRSDGPPTGYSNFGLLARFDEGNRALGATVWREMRDRLSAPGTAVFQSLASFIEGGRLDRSPVEPAGRPWRPMASFRPGSVREVLGDSLADILAGAVRELIAWSPDLLGPRTVCIAPAIEGTGGYPDIDGDLRVHDEAIWCAGDVAGRFRGLVPALVSGYYAGLSAADQLSRSAALEGDLAW